MTIFAGLAIDVSRTLSAKTTFDASADAAALAAATAAESVLQSPVAQALQDLGVGLAQTTGAQAGQQMFSADAQKAGMWAGGLPTPTITVALQNQIITATVTYVANVPTVFGGIAGVKTIAIQGTAKSSLTLPKYLNISVAVDISQSMGLAATSTGMSQLQSLTPDGCAFGCHVVSSDQANAGSPWSTTPYETIAHQNNIQLRIDVIRTATQNMIQTAQSLQGSSGMISFGIYALQGGTPYAPGLPLTILAPSSSNYPALLTAAGNIDLGPNTAGGMGDTDFPDSMPALTAVIPAGGNGSSFATAQQYVFLMTDGVQDVANGTTNCVDNVWGHCTAPFAPSQCATLKAKGVIVGVIYTTYLSMPGDPRYTPLVSNFASQIAPNLQSCASPGWFYQASDATDIQAAINALFAKATGAGVLTQ